MNWLERKGSYMPRCPGQDQRFWKPEDIFEVKCLNCGQPIEFFRDEPKLKCRKCGQIILNPKINLSCTEWCKHAGRCQQDRDDKMIVISGKIGV